MRLREYIPTVKKPKQTSDLVTSERTKSTALAYLVTAEMHPPLNIRLHGIDKLRLSPAIVVSFAGPWGGSWQSLVTYKGSGGSTVTRFGCFLRALPLFFHTQSSFERPHCTRLPHYRSSEFIFRTPGNIVYLCSLCYFLKENFHDLPSFCVVWLID